MNGSEAQKNSFNSLAIRKVFVLVDRDQCCYISHALEPKSKINEMLNKQSRWTGFAVVEELNGTFSDAAACCRKWRVIAAMNGYEALRNPRILEYCQYQPWFAEAEKQARFWPFKVKTLFPERKRPFNPKEERFMKRDRHIYVIADRFMRCYVGQAVNVKRRISQHFSGRESATSDWLKEVPDAEKLVVATIHGTYWDAQKAEYKWRFIAQMNGYQNMDIIGDLSIDDDLAGAAHQDMLAWPFQRMTGMYSGIAQ
jgi:predicted GIY-YIG superfamily endonuclease